MKQARMIRKAQAEGKDISSLPPPPASKGDKRRHRVKARCWQ